MAQNLDHLGGSLTQKIVQKLKTNSKFTIHPFKSLHAKTLLPLSIKDYAYRFGLELVVLFIATFGLIVNFTLSAHANRLESSDNSVIFSFLKSNPTLNSSLLASSDTTTILARTDRLVNQAWAQSSFSSALLASQTGFKSENLNPTTIQENVIVKTNPADSDSPLREGRTVYKVEPGDNLVSIASSFGISPQTIMVENKIDETTILKPGQELTILPTTGITYTLKESDTLESILAKYKISEDDFLDANNVELFEDLEPGTSIVIPLENVSMPAKPKPASQFVKVDSGKIALKQATAPGNLVGGLNFIWPTSVRTITQGFFKRHAGIDISNSKKEPIFASEAGFVELSGWQSGWGNTIIINHGNGYKTRYSHASELYVKAGDQVAKGQTIAKQGNTGRVRGVTGIHLDFRIMKNGVSLNPLGYVKP
ncbi:MAG: M23 family metallopeptidase [Candidatus Doudnabacteria bacterium]|nr:M23 family metallopeptidase [Candidatus Doudnabacteria bacterium]